VKRLFGLGNRRLNLTVTVVIFSIILLVLVILSPLALRWLGTSTKINWLQRSNIGQTYGAVSALLTAMALIGVTASLYFQARDVRNAREQAWRTAHHELIKMELDDPLYMTATGAPWDMPIPAERDKLREHLFILLWVSFWERQYRIGEMTDDEVRLTSEHELFNGRPGREFWEHAGNLRLTYARDRRARRFNKILDVSYHNAIRNRPLAATPISAEQAKKPVLHSSKFDMGKIIGSLFLAAGVGALVNHRARLWTQRKISRDRR
jgi:hypothetical protein